MTHLNNKLIYYYFPATLSYMHTWQNTHFINELQHYNIHFKIFNPIETNNIEENILKSIKQNKPQISFFMTSVFDNEISPSLIKSIKELGIPTLLIAFDNISIPYRHKKIAKYFDLVWITSHETEYLFKKWQAKTIFLPYAANPFIFKPINEKEINSIGFIGSLYGMRAKRILDISRHNLPIEIYGKPLDQKQNNPNHSTLFDMISFRLFTLFNLSKFPIGRQCIIGNINRRLFYSNIDVDTLNELSDCHKGPVTFENMIKLYSNLSLTLGISELWDTLSLKNPIHKIHLRAFEIPMSGGLQITSYNNEITEYFEPDKEIILFESTEELIDKTKFYLKEENQKIRNIIKQNARRRAENEHTWQNRFEKISKTIFN